MDIVQVSKMAILFILKCKLQNEEYLRMERKKRFEMLESNCTKNDDVVSANTV
jgi:hypothetical protein